MPLNNMTPTDRFHADPEKSFALPSYYYYDADIAAKEADAIFADSWQYVGHAEQLAAAGSYITRDIAGESIVILRGHDNRLRAFFNVCSHRAHPLLKDAGQTDAIGLSLSCVDLCVGREINRGA